MLGQGSQRFGSDGMAGDTSSTDEDMLDVPPPFLARSPGM